MNEVRALVEAFDAANAMGARCSLATVVSVEGSSYRRPGARMLVGEAGTCTGTISAGCLETDVIEHAKRVMRTQAATLVEYDTASTSDDAAWGLGLGCNGVVRVLIEPLTSDSPYIEALRRNCLTRPDEASVSVATVYRYAPINPASAVAGLATGARLFVSENGDVSHEQLREPMVALLEQEVRAMGHSEVTSAARTYRPDQWRSHIARDRSNGVTLIETITHLAFYAGWPSAVTAIGVAREVFKR